METYRFRIYDCNRRKSIEFERYGGQSVKVLCEDVTGCTDYVEMVVTAESPESAAHELNAQINDGVLENYSTGDCFLISGGEEIPMVWDGIQSWYHMPDVKE